MSGRLRAKEHEKILHSTIVAESREVLVVATLDSSNSAKIARNKQDEIRMRGINLLLESI